MRITGSNPTDISNQYTAYHLLKAKWPGSHKEPSSSPVCGLYSILLRSSFPLKYMLSSYKVHMLNVRAQSIDICVSQDDIVTMPFIYTCQASGIMCV